MNEEYSMPFDAKMLISIQALKKFRHYMDDYIFSLEEFMKLKSKVSYFEQKMSDNLFSLTDEEMDELVDLNQRLIVANETIQNAQNKMYEMSTAIKDLF